MLVSQSCPILCDPMDCSLPGSSVHGVLQARILEGVAMPSSRGSPQLRDQTWVSCIAGWLFTVWTTSGARYVCMLSRFSHVWLKSQTGKHLWFKSCKIIIFIMKVETLVSQSCPILCDPMDYNPLGSSVHGILQARILESVAIPSSTGSFWPRDRTHISCSSCTVEVFFTAEPWGSLIFYILIIIPFIVSFTQIYPSTIRFINYLY